MEKTGKCKAFCFNQTQQGVQGLQEFAFSFVTVNDEHTKLGLKESVGVKFKEGICAELCLKLCFKSDCPEKKS